jgi:uncharacterized 2Fe-2S/4Fe-4S cluster protein (DUF4445 family)
MREAEVPVTFRPAGRKAYVLAGTSLIEAAAEAGVILDSPCGGAGTCGKCRVIIKTAAAPPTDREKSFFSPGEIRQGFRLACQTEVLGPTTVYVPETSVLTAKHQMLVQTEKGPAISEDLTIDLPHGGVVTDLFAAAFDIGTTTLAATLIDPQSANDLAAVAKLNPQTQFGDDVISRIQFARDNPQGLQILRDSIVRAVNDMLAALCLKAGIKREQIVALAFAGNTAMLHLLCGVDPSGLGAMPFRPTTVFGVSMHAAKLNLLAHLHAEAYIFPTIGGFVGGDTVAGILATQLTGRPGPALLVDIGTNGEIVLWAGGKLAAASTAAGPAFEGARISCGMRGCEGAIEKVLVDHQLRINVIGNVAPAGLCGSGLIDVAAELLRHRILAPDGKLRTPDELPAGVLPDLRERIILHNGKVAFLLASEEESAAGKPLVLTGRDFRELQLAAGAIRTGIAILLRRAGLKPQELNDVFIAGGFGNFIRRSNAQRIGLLPGEIEHHRIRFCGNASLAGAQLAALSRHARTMAEDLARQTEHVELAADPDFARIFADSMLFPET